VILGAETILTWMGCVCLVHLRSGAPTIRRAEQPVEYLVVAAGTRRSRFTRWSKARYSDLAAHAGVAPLTT
jgi:hypothetical protein